MLVARSSTCEVDWHTWKHRVVPTVWVAQVTGIRPVFTAGTWHYRRDTTAIRSWHLSPMTSSAYSTTKNIFQWIKSAQACCFFSGWPMRAWPILVVIECSGNKPRPLLNSGAQTWRTKSVRLLFLQPVRDGNRLALMPNHTLKFLSVWRLPVVGRTSNPSWYLYYEYRRRPTSFQCVLWAPNTPHLFYAFETAI